MVKIIQKHMLNTLLPLNLKVSSESVVIDSKTLALKDLQNALRVAVPVAARQDGGSPLLKASCYVVSPDRQLVMVEKDKTFDDLSYFSPSSVDDLNDTLFKQVCLFIYIC